MAKLKPKKAIPAQKLILRMVEIHRAAANEEARTIPVTIATETPVLRYDDASGTWYPEVLLMEGLQLRGGRTQLPIVDSHDRSTTRNVLGSVRNLKVEGSRLVGEAMFARDAESQVAYQKLLDGHLTDFSITATPLEQRAVRQGESVNLLEQELNGPAVVVTQWEPVDASLVAAGADVNSTVRELLRSYFQPQTERMEMLDESTKEKLVAMGMPEQIDNLADAMAWMLELHESASVEVEMEMAEEPKVENMEGEKPTEENPMVESEEHYEDKPKMENAVKRERARQREIRSLCNQAKIERAFADQLCDSGANIDTAREKVLKRMIEKNKPVGTTARVTAGESGSERFGKVASSALIARSLRAVGARSGFDGLEQGYEQYANMPLVRLAELVLRHSGVDTDRIANQADIARLAVGHRSTVRRFTEQGIIRDAYHTTGSFANLMLDAANKTLLQGYEEAPFTWNLWARQAPSVADFKAINRIRFSESPDPEMVPERALYKEKAMSDSKESYTVDKYGALFTVSWETIVNDDLDAISRVPQMHGNAARRKVNKAVYSVLTSNPTMGDGVSLFSASGHASGRNLAATPGAPSVTTLNAAFIDMMTQKGLSADAVINVQPRYLIVPVALSATALQLVGSLSDPGAGGSAAGNANTLNVYGPNGSRPLQVIAEPQLDANSASRWYLAADPSQIDTVEVTFLQGEESPVLESEWDFDRDVWKYKVRQTFGTKAIDWRGLHRNGS
jgi:hypothetical protein